MASSNLKKRIHFLQLTFIFGAVSIFTLLAQWGYSSGQESSMKMMGQSMGTMMKMHAQNISINDLIKQKVQDETTSVSSNSSSHSSHHDEANSYLKLMHYITTATIVILLPFILAGTVFLGIDALLRR